MCPRRSMLCACTSHYSIDTVVCSDLSCRFVTMIPVSHMFRNYLNVLRMRDRVLFTKAYPFADATQHAQALSSCRERWIAAKRSPSDVHLLLAICSRFRMAGGCASDVLKYYWPAAEAFDQMPGTPFPGDVSKTSGDPDGPEGMVSLQHV
jgi:hypothetical protein